MLWISITLKNALSSAGFESVNSGSNGKHVATSLVQLVTSASPVDFQFET
jgi:hypothetical protein